MTPGLLLFGINCFILNKREKEITILDKYYNEKDKEEAMTACYGSHLSETSGHQIWGKHVSAIKTKSKSQPRLNADIWLSRLILFDGHLVRSRKASTVCTASTSPPEDAEVFLGDFPGWIRTTRTMPMRRPWGWSLCNSKEPGAPFSHKPFCPEMTRLRWKEIATYECSPLF